MNFLSPVLSNENITLEANDINEIDTSNIIVTHSMFETACRDGDLLLAKQLLEINKDVNLDSSLDEKTPSLAFINFRSAFFNNHLEICEWLLYLTPNLNISYNNEECFCKVCMEGNIELAKWLYNINNKINISIYFYYPFKIACKNGHIDIAKWIISICDINDNAYDCAFCDACSTNQLHILKWLYEIKPEINVKPKINIIQKINTNSKIDSKPETNSEQETNKSIITETSFRIACENGNLEIAKWLYETNSSLNIHALYGIAFLTACYNNHYEVANWIKSIEPTKYEISEVCQENGKIIKCKGKFIK
jgi:hypothetical protein